MHLCQLTWVSYGLFLTWWIATKFVYSAAPTSWVTENRREVKLEWATSGSVQHSKAADNFKRSPDTLQSWTSITLAADASPYGIGAFFHTPCKMMMSDQSKVEKNYAQIDKEALALV